MPITPTYPGVYIAEIPTGIRPITGVSTSVTAFVGLAKYGPLNRATHILSYADYERFFGGLASSSEMSYAVRQFFLNGGSEAWIIRLTQDTTCASLELKADNQQNSQTILTITAHDPGNYGSAIEIQTDYQTNNPASTFNLTVNFPSSDNPTQRQRETYTNLSMNKNDGHYIEKMVNDVSNLVTVKRDPDLNLDNLKRGTSVSGELADIDQQLNDTHNQFRVSIDGSEPITVTLAPQDWQSHNGASSLKSLSEAITQKVSATVADFTCTEDGKHLTMTSPTQTEASSVHVLPGFHNDVAASLKLGPRNGGTEVDAAASLRPQEMPDHGTWTSRAITSDDVKDLTDDNKRSFRIALDGYVPQDISLDTGEPINTDNLADALKEYANRIESAVRGLKTTIAAYQGFTCTAINGDQLQLTSGTRGQGSLIRVSATPASSMASKLHLLVNTGATIKDAQIQTLRGGTEHNDPSGDQFNLFIGSRAQHKGIYQLEEVDHFSLLCLPGITDPDILTEAASYCQERRAFLIVDPPTKSGDEQLSPESMLNTITGPGLPKSEYAALYYPSLFIADPLNGGKPRLSAPCGTIAGVYARIDSMRGVWKAPAGTEATLIGVQGLKYRLTDAENGLLNPHAVNCLRIFPVYGAVCWGARTLGGDDQMASDYKYVPVRRLALYIEESLYRGTKWAVFEPNDEPLWAQIRLNIGSFMHTLFRQGAFQGKTPREAYFVKCDRETTTQNDINQGIVNILVGFAPLKPAEFVMIQIRQLAGQIAV